MNKTVQFFTDTYLDECKKISNEEKLEFLDNYQRLYFQSLEARSSKTRLISVKIEESLLQAFRICALTESIPYQTQIKKLMKEWVLTRTQKRN